MVFALRLRARGSMLMNNAVSMFKGAISHSPYRTHGSGFVASYYLLMLATYFYGAR